MNLLIYETHLILYSKNDNGENEEYIICDSILP